MVGRTSTVMARFGRLPEPIVELIVAYGGAAPHRSAASRQRASKAFAVGVRAVWPGVGLRPGAFWDVPSR